jgi:hypothetical protein
MSSGALLIFLLIREDLLSAGAENRPFEAWLEKESGADRKSSRERILFFDFRSGFCASSPRRAEIAGRLGAASLSRTLKK